MNSEASHRKRSDLFKSKLADLKDLDRRFYEARQSRSSIVWRLKGVARAS